jgi:hypothetical protein
VQPTKGVGEQQRHCGETEVPAGDEEPRSPWFAQADDGGLLRASVGPLDIFAR